MDINQTLSTSVESPKSTAESQPKVSAVDALFADKKSSIGQIKPESEKKETVAVTDKQDSAAKQLALIARESKRLAAEKQAFIEELEKTKTELQELKELREWKKARQDRIKSDPLHALKDEGLDYNELIRAELQRQQEEADPTLKKVRELEHKLSEKERIEAENQVKYAEQQQQRYIDQHVADIRAHIAANQEKFEFLSTYKAEKDVFAKIKEVFDASVKKDAQGRIKEFKELTIEEACGLVEAEFEESASALTKLKKIQSKFIKQEQKSQPIQQETKEKPKSSTLTNALSGSSEKPRALTKAERVERAFAALHSQH